MPWKWHAGASFVLRNKLFCGVGGINYACDLADNSINYKHYNLRGDVTMTTGPAGNVLSELWYAAYGEYEGFGTLPSDKYRANTKVDDGELILDGHRYRNKALMRFMSPDPLEYIDGLNCYIYCSNNPWGRFDPDGLAQLIAEENKEGPPINTGKLFDIIEIWAKGKGLSDLIFDPKKDYYTAQETKFTVKYRDGKIEKTSLVVLRAVQVVNGKMRGQAMKEILQDDYNLVGISEHNISSIKIETFFNIYEGKIPSEAQKSNVTCADSVIENSIKRPLNEAKNLVGITSYTRSQVENEHPFISTAKNMEEFEKINNTGNPLDTSNILGRNIVLSDEHRLLSDIKTYTRNRN